MLTCHVLGPTEIGAGRERVDLGGPMPRRLITALVAADGRPVSEDTLTLAVWGDDPPASPAVSLQAYVSRLRRALGQHRDALERVGDGYRLAGAGTDVADFEAGVARGRDLLGEQRPAEAVRAFDAALRLWRGEAFADLGASAEIETDRVRLAELRLVAVEERLAALLAVGDAPGAVAGLTPAVREEPYRERRWELLILGLYRSARQAEALSALRRVRSLLADDLGVDPGPALQSLERRLLSQDPMLLLPPPPSPPSPLPPTSSEVTRPLSTFVGRTAELGTLTATMRTARLMTLVGPGGAGKTRLAVEYAATSTGSDGPWLARLADVTDPALLLSAVATALGIRETPATDDRTGATDGLASTDLAGSGSPVTSASEWRPGPGVGGSGGLYSDGRTTRAFEGSATGKALVSALTGREALLILDNCEHLVGAAADLVVGLLARCPRLRIVATSREPLGVDGERLLPVTPLPSGAAVALLVDRIGAIRPGWQPDPEDLAELARLAEALDGIPLALELAAARARVLGLGELVALLGERFPELGRVPRGALTPHATLEATVAWSVDLLSVADRALLLRLWPFEGGFTLEAAAAVGSDLEALSALVTRSVVAADTTVAPTRYRLLEIIRAFCRERDPDPAASRAAHAAWVRALVDRSSKELRGERSARAIRVLNRELPNLRAALAHDLVADPAAALRTAGRLEWFWFRGGHVSEGLRLLTAALAGAPAADDVTRAQAWASCGILHYIAGNLDRAAECLRQAKDLLAEPPDRDGWRLLGQVLYYEGLLWSLWGDFDRSRLRATESIAVSRRIGEEWIEPAGAMTLGTALVGLGQVEEGRTVLADAAAHAGRLGQNWIAGMSELLLARSWLQVADPSPAAALDALRGAVDRFREEDDIGDVLACLHSGAYALVLSGRLAEGATLLASVRRHGRRRGMSLEASDPATSAALAGAGVPEAAGTLDEAAMIALLQSGQDEEHARR
ncbi:BTAD domain-containing putative transcriptional regulator [Actinoplanes friuliensis]|uniref:Winged helix family transcriptional regulator n=1 Tax=Actinoplanes friuliensis DSM 7358 TaxID=1246995 RepID=U5WBS5_9ACTN|nr:BTAD domain-containing putative transcriptional regulator [Actinoplanes friuliensis]AGZ45411.1 winged helix family transcriptional regulator [Actinoplanes friuliensis DSM 7358]